MPKGAPEVIYHQPVGRCFLDDATVLPAQPADNLLVSTQQDQAADPFPPAGGSAGRPLCLSLHCWQAQPSAQTPVAVQLAGAEKP